MILRFASLSGTWTRRLRVSSTVLIVLPTFEAKFSKMNRLFSIMIYRYFAVKLNGKRVVTGILRGFDPFMNLVVDEAVEIRKDKTQKFLGIVVSHNSARIRRT